MQSKGLSRVFSITIVQKQQFFCVQLFVTVHLSHPYMTTEKTIGLTRWTFVDKIMSLLYNMLSRLVITLLPRSKHLLISWLQSPSAVILEPRKIKSVTVSPDLILSHFFNLQGHRGKVQCLSIKKVKKGIYLWLIHVGV